MRSGVMCYRTRFLMWLWQRRESSCHKKRGAPTLLSISRQRASRDPQGFAKGQQEHPHPLRRVGSVNKALVISQERVHLVHHPKSSPRICPSPCSTHLCFWPSQTPPLGGAFPSLVPGCIMRFSSCAGPPDACKGRSPPPPRWLSLAVCPCKTRPGSRGLPPAFKALPDAASNGVPLPPGPLQGALLCPPFSCPPNPAIVLGSLINEMGGTQGLASMDIVKRRMR